MSRSSARPDPGSGDGAPHESGGCSPARGRGGVRRRLAGRRAADREPLPDLSEDPYRLSSLDPPTWRGRMHAVLILPSVGAGIWLVVVTPGAGRRAVVALYAAGVVLALAVSAAFHLRRWSDEGWLRMRRWDHIAIFGLIAGSYGAVMGLGVTGAARDWVLGAALAMCALGAAMRWRSLHPRFRLMTSTYMLIGIVSLFAIRPILAGIGLLGTVVTFAGCGVFGLGALGLGLCRPNPWPGRFEYHEVWHLNVIIAVGCQYWVVAGVVVPAL